MSSRSNRNITILALGSRGDVQPFVALGLGLRAAGYGVRIAAAADYAALVEAHDLSFVPLVGRISDLMDRELVYAAFEAGANPLPFARRFRDAVTPLMETLFVDCLAAAQGAELLIVSTLGIYPGDVVAERCGLRVIEAHFHPVTPTATLPHAFFPELPLLGPLRRLYHRLTHRLGAAGMNGFLWPALNRARKAIGLSPRPLRDLLPPPSPRLALHAYSPHIAPPPPDWNPVLSPVTGYWPLPAPADYHLPAALENFLNDGPPPIYLGFGSLLAGRHPDNVTRLLLAALEQANCRGVLYRGWGDVGKIPLPPSVFLTEGAYHDVLFPRLAAIVHHGGAGTSAAAVRSGIPSVVVPFFGDQRFWAGRLRALGVSPPPIPRSELTVERLAAALHEATNNPSYRMCTNDLRVHLAAECGVEEAISWISSAFASSAKTV